MSTRRSERAMQRSSPGASSMSRRGSTSSRGSSKSFRPLSAPPPPKRIDRLVAEPSFAAFWPEPEPEAGAGDVAARRTWQLENFSPEQIRALVPDCELPEPPKAARDAYWFFDREKRPTLDNEQLYADARKDRSRPKLSTMQVRAIDSMWEEAGSDERAHYDELEQQDKARYDNEMASTAKARAAVQAQAAAVELSQFLKSIGLQQYGPRLNESGLRSIAQMRDSMRNGRWMFLGKIEDAGMSNELHQQQLRNALNNLVVAKPRPSTAEKTPAQLARERKRAAQEESRKQAELAAQMKAEAAEEAVDRKRRMAEKSASEKRSAEARLLLDDYGMACDPDAAEVILQSRHGQGVLAGQQEYLVRWEMGAGKMTQDGDPIDRSWVPEALLLSSPGSSQLLQQFHEQEKLKKNAAGPLAVVAYDPDFAQMDFGARMKDPRKVVLRKKTKIVRAAIALIAHTDTLPVHSWLGVLTIAPTVRAPFQLAGIRRCAALVGVVPVSIAAAEVRARRPEAARFPAGPPWAGQSRRWLGVQSPPDYHVCMWMPAAAL